MNPENEVMGKMRTAHTAVLSARDTLREMYEETDAMLPGPKATELNRLVKEIDDALEDMKPPINVFLDLAERRKPTP